MALPALVDGAMPLGRWPATPDQVADAFVVGQSDQRQQVWSDWLELTSALKGAVGSLPAAWLSGSFLTDKAEPADVDSVYMVEWAAMRSLPLFPQKASFVEVVARSAAKDVFGLSVDSFIIEWWPRSGTSREAWTKQYLEDRGYWDDLWSRQRSADSRLDAMPRRGYVEVMLDGYI